MLARYQIQNRERARADNDNDNALKSPQHTWPDWQPGKGCKCNVSRSHFNLPTQQRSSFYAGKRGARLRSKGGKESFEQWGTGISWSELLISIPNNFKINVNNLWFCVCLNCFFYWQAQFYLHLASVACHMIFSCWNNKFADFFITHWTHICTRVLS